MTKVSHPGYQSNNLLSNAHKNKNRPKMSSTAPTHRLTQFNAPFGQLLADAGAKFNLASLFMRCRCSGYVATSA
jgi:hypothetical protein